MSLRHVPGWCNLRPIEMLRIVQAGKSLRVHPRWIEDVLVKADASDRAIQRRKEVDLLYL